MIEQYEVSDNQVMDALELEAKVIVQELRKLPRPRSKIRKAGYTHLIDTMCYRRKKREIEVGWGKYYGPMIENGTVKMHGTPHLRPYLKTNEEKIIEKVVSKLWN